MRKIALIFSEAALELVPKEIVSNPMFAEEGRKRHKKPGEILLDSNKHNLPMRSLGNPDRRGRPDILHFSLLAAMETLANKAGLLQQISVHTLDGTLLEISREARLPRIYNRFCGIMEQVLAGGENQFIKMTGPIPFKDVLSGVMPKLRGKEHAAPIFFNESGTRFSLKNFSSLVGKELVRKTDAPLVFILGCFPHGEFSPAIRKFLLESGAAEVKFGDDALPVWTLVSMAINSYELEAGL